MIILDTNQKMIAEFTITESGFCDVNFSAPSYNTTLIIRIKKQNVGHDPIIFGMMLRKYYYRKSFGC